ncbi:MAG: LLM class flavin-dependent oxidoreductase [Proteobacteria bacterium]|nr:LLM class flavin-dependent oxidoreductase [Pseudomonadota bacterium]
MTQPRQLRLGAFMRPVSIHTAAWRYPGGTPDANFNLQALVQYAQTLERGRFDAFFMADHLAVLNMPMEALKRSATVTSFDPLTLLPALSMVTKHLGLIATASTTFEPPYTIARRFASLDHISGGRAGWNIVTTSNPDAALNFGMDEQMEHDERYARAREFYDVVTGLWDSWADDAFIRDVESGIYFDPAKLHVLNHKGKHFKVRGPLNVACSPQGRPVLVQAGASGTGRDVAARLAEVVFTAQTTFEQGKEFYSDVMSRLPRFGRTPDEVKVMPGFYPVVAPTASEAQEKYDYLQSLIQKPVGLSILEHTIGVHHLDELPLDGPVPEMADTNGPLSRQRLLLEQARRDKLTLWELCLANAGPRGHVLSIGTPSQVADEMEHWFTGHAADGFNVMPAWLPGSLQDFVDLVIPELQRRGLFRKEYEGMTLRENLGLPKPLNRHHAQRFMGAAQ